MKIIGMGLLPYKPFSLSPAAEAVASINATMATDDPASLLEALRNEYAHLNNIEDAQAPHYLTLLKAARAAKVKSSGDEDAQLTMEEIQSVIDEANAQTVEAKECKLECTLSHTLTQVSITRGGTTSVRLRAPFM